MIIGNVHIFSSFFHLKLLEAGYNAVRKWVRAYEREPAVSEG